MGCSQKNNVNPDIIVIPTGLWVHPKSPELGCSPDGLVYDPSMEQNVYGLLEIKCPLLLKDHDVCDFKMVLTPTQQNTFCLESEGTVIRLKKSHAYFYQVQMQMAIMNLKWCDFVVWSAKGLIVLKIEFEPEFWDEIQPKLINFQHSQICPEFFEMRICRNLPPLLNQNDDIVF